MHSPAQSTARYDNLVQRLSVASVTNHFDAYADVAWDDPEFQIDPRDPRWQLAAQDPLGGTAWYQAQAPDTRSRIGLDLIAARTKLGLEFENVLSRGLLEFAATCGNGSPEYRYAYHELIEEGQHSLMFQEFVNRSGSDPVGLRGWQGISARSVPRLGRVFPELFFSYVLAGEIPIDCVQRDELRSGDARHPLMRRIMRLHVTEEARHVCFAQQYLAARLPQLSRVRLARVRWMAPFITFETAKQMLLPPSWLLRRHGVPRAVATEARQSNNARTYIARAVQPLVENYRELGVITPATARLWHALGRVRPAPRLRSAEPRRPTR